MKRWTGMEALGALSPGARVIALLAVMSGVWVGVRAAGTGARASGLEFWMFSPEHRKMYEGSFERWESSGHEALSVSVFGPPALERRMTGGFLSGVETADLIEAERAIVGSAFAGPLEAVGFVDLTERIEAEGLREIINPPSFSAWTSRGRVFGLPHDVHPVMLGYRSDLVEAAGIDVSEIETWGDFARVMRPLMADADGDGAPDRYLLGFWPTHEDNLEVLMLQAGARMFDDDERLVMDGDVHAEALAEVVSWCLGDDRWAADVFDFTNASNLQKVEGYAVAYFMPDWMCNIWKVQIKQLSGKVKLMPLPAFEPGGRRTSVRGGTMLGLARTSTDQEEAWAFAKELYLSDRLAEELYTTTDIITPITRHWSKPLYDEPDPFFSGQPKGRMYIELAPSVPSRTSSPYYRTARLALRNAATELFEWALSAGVDSKEDLVPKAREVLGRHAERVRRDMDRNVFVGGGER